MRMKFNKPGQLLLVSAASLVAAGLLTACSQLTATLTVDFVFVTSAKAAGPNNYGDVDVFEINAESGQMRQIPTSPFPSGGRNPVAEAVSTDHANLYVVNQDDNTIVQFVIGNDGKLYPQNTVNTPGVFPLAVSVAKSNLYVADTYQPLPTCSPAAPCSGSVAVFPILPAVGSTPSGAMQTGTPINDCNGLTYLPLNLTGAGANHAITPTAVNASADGSNLFVSAYDATGNTGFVFAFSVGTMQCPQPPNPFSTVPTLTPFAGSPFATGVHPSALATDPTGTYLYVADSASNHILAYVVGSGSGLTPVGGNPFPAGNQPSSIVIDATGKFAAVTNSLDSTVNTYSLGSGALTQIGTFATGLQPVAVGIDPSLNQYVFTANFLGNTVSGFELVSGTGSLLNTQNSPFTANAQPTAVAAIPHKDSN
jgi:6-phosphogluconolactonase